MLSFKLPQNVTFYGSFVLHLFLIQSSRTGKLWVVRLLYGCVHTIIGNIDLNGTKTHALCLLAVLVLIPEKLPYRPR